MIMRRFIPPTGALLAFEAAARHLNFTRAAEDLGLTQSGVSRQIRTLETFLGTRLFDRIGPRLVLTGTGESFAAEVGRLLDGLETAAIDAVRGRSLAEGLRLAALPSLAARVLAPRMGRFRALNPDLAFELTSLTALPGFADTDLDLAVLRGHGAGPGPMRCISLTNTVPSLPPPTFCRPAPCDRPKRFVPFRNCRTRAAPTAG